MARLLIASIILLSVLMMTPIDSSSFCRPEDTVWAGVGHGILAVGDYVILGQDYSGTIEACPTPVELGTYYYPTIKSTSCGGEGPSITIWLDPVQAGVSHGARLRVDSIHNVGTYYDCLKLCFCEPPE